MCLRCRLILRCQNQPPGDCWPGVKPVYLVSEPTSRRLLAWSAACLYGFRTYLMGTVGQGWFLIGSNIRYQSLPPEDLARGESCLYRFPTYLQGTACRSATCLYCLQICSDSFTILGLWVLGLATSNINESRLQTNESKTLFLITSLPYYCIPGLAGTR